LVSESPVVALPALMPAVPAALPRATAHESRPTVHVTRAGVQSALLVLFVILVSAWYAFHLPVPQR
jgi:hypothetical protein